MTITWTKNIKTSQPLADFWWFFGLLRIQAAQLEDAKIFANTSQSFW